MARNTPPVSVHETEEEEEFLPGYPTVVSFTQTCFSKLVKATQKANDLPNPGDDFEFYSSFSDFREFCKSQGSRMLSNVERLMKFQHVKCGWPSDLDEETSMETDDMFECLVEANDTLLEQIDSCLDEASGLRKNKKPVLPRSMQQGSPVVSSWNKSSHRGNQQEDKLRFLHAKNILRPQLKFKEKPDNSNVPFVPIIKEKPNALKALEKYAACQTDTPDDDQDVPAALANFIHEQRLHKVDDKNHQSNSHPYQFELQEFEPEKEDLNVKEVQMYKPLDETSLTFVDNVEKLSLLLSVLKGVTEFAIDLEHHSFRSFQGIVCLMQISTRNEDYLIDTLELRSELPILNQVFTDPKILKVLHGADMDIGWLQRDFGLYMVNMFDTGQATRTLQYPRFSLAFLLKKFCDVTADKQYQLADWRIRPLPSEMVVYAREDTHYLLYVYDRLRNELISKGNVHNNLLESTYKRSKAICLKTYEKPLFTSESYLALYHRHKKSLNPNQLEALRLLYAWRDEMARLEDESYAYVLPNHMLFGIAEVLPKAPQGVLACCNPIPSLVRQNINVIHRLVVQARDLAPKLHGPTTPWTTPTRSCATTNGLKASDSIVNMDASGVVTSVEKKNDDTKMKCEAMLAFKKYPITGPAVRIAKPKISLFACGGEDKELSEGEKKAAVVQESFKNPFQAFLPAKKSEEILKQKSSEEINQQWKTKSEEMKQTTADQDVANNTEDERRKRKHGSSLEKDEDNEEENVPLREPKKNKKKKEKNEKGNQTLQINITSPFVPFDYSSANLDFASKHGEQTKEIFNPYNKMTEKTKRFSSKVHMKSGERSMTFSKKK